MIHSFENTLTEAIFNNRAPKGFPSDIAKAARRKLKAIHAATLLSDI